MPGLVDFINNNPLALIAAAQGLLTPGHSQGQRFGQGMSGLVNGVFAQSQYDEATRDRKKREEAEAALARLGNPRAYEPTQIEVGGQSQMPQGPQMSMAPGASPPALSRLQGMVAPQQPRSIELPPENSMMGDMMRVAPQAVIEQRLKAMMDPMANLPEAMQTALMLRENPGLRDFMPGFQDRESTAEKNVSAVYGADWRTNPEAVRYFETITQPASISMNTAVDPRAQASVNVQTELLKKFNDEAMSFGDIDFVVDRFSDALSQWDSTGAMGNARLALGRIAAGIGVDVAGLSEGEVMSSLTSYLTPRMRVPGSGATSDMEMRTFMDAIPNMLRTPGGNQRVIEYLKKFGERKRAASDIAVDLFEKGELTYGNVYRELKAQGLDRIIPDGQIMEFRRGNLSGMPLTQDGFNQMTPNQLFLIDPTKLTAEQRTWMDNALTRYERGGP